MALKARTLLACEIAGVNRDRLNEAVHFGHYPCAPATRPGAARVFEVNDIIALRFYARFLAEGLSASAAGERACVIHDVLRRWPAADRIVQVVTSLSTHWLTGEAFDPKQTHFEGADIVEVHEYRLWNLRAFIEHRLREESEIVGEGA